MTLDEAGKLVNLGGHCLGQWWSGADEFAKRANEVFKFKNKNGLQKFTKQKELTDPIKIS